MMPWSETGSWVAGLGSAEWWVTWVMGHKMRPICQLCGTCRNLDLIG